MSPRTRHIQERDVTPRYAAMLRRQTATRGANDSGDAAPLIFAHGRAILSRVSGRRRVSTECHATAACHTGAAAHVRHATERYTRATPLFIIIAWYTLRQRERANALSYAPATLSCLQRYSSRMAEKKKQKKTCRCCYHNVSKRPPMLQRH